MEPDSKTAESLMRAATDVAANAYAPYSGFAVGAVIVAVSGKQYTGVNVENAAYGISICAERVALARAVSAGERKFDVLAVAARDGADAPPCGECRQALVEFSPSMAIVYRSGGQTVIKGLDALIPDTFGDHGNGPTP